MADGMDRRAFIGHAGVGAGLILGGVPVWADAARRRRRGIPFAKTGRFTEGVASGEPSTNGITLWTRLSGGYRTDRKLFLEISKDDDFRRIAYRRNVVARAARDHTITVRVQGKRFLDPGERYYYRFTSRERESPVGRFKLPVPDDSQEPVRIAFFSCQDWQAGHYGAHQTIADLDDLDLVVCLGDYIYERNFYEGPRKDELGANGDGEVQTLEEYRQKYAMYKGDADLQAMHAKHPFMAIWDDHEVEDNYAGDEPGDATKDRRIPYAERQIAGYRSFYEYMPFGRIRGQAYRLYRSLRLGRNVELFMLDERQYRDDQPCNDEFFTPCDELDDPNRKLLGDEQKEWFKNGVAGSGANWKLAANQLMVMALDTAQGQAINKDQWDGYAAERREILEFFKQRGVKDLAFLTGDIHTFFAGDVTPTGRGTDVVAPEFVGGSITSLGIPETIESITGAPPDASLFVTGQVRTANPHIKYDQQTERGYGYAEATPDELKVEFRAVTARPERSTDARTIGRFRVARGNPRMEVL